MSWTPDSLLPILPPPGSAPVNLGPGPRWGGVPDSNLGSPGKPTHLWVRHLPMEVLAMVPQRTLFFMLGHVRFWKTFCPCRDGLETSSPST